MIWKGRQTARRILLFHHHIASSLPTTLSPLSPRQYDGYQDETERRISARVTAGGFRCRTSRHHIRICFDENQRRVTCFRFPASLRIAPAHYAPRGPLRVANFAFDFLPALARRHGVDHNATSTAPERAKSVTDFQRSLAGIRLRAEQVIDIDAQPCV